MVIVIKSYLRELLVAVRGTDAETFFVPFAARHRGRDTDAAKYPSRAEGRDRMKHRYEILALGLALLCGCSDSGVSGNSADAPAVTGASPVTDGWLGRWNGPEGTFVLLERADDGYRVTIQNLDGPRAFPGVVVGEQVQFERDGVAEVVRATDGAATGMKWLADKTNCLTVRYGEGYCRD
jgi:hypothetical protein